MTKDSSLEKDTAVSHQQATLPAAGVGSVPQQRRWAQGTDAAPVLLLNLCFHLLFSLVFIGIISSELSSGLLTMFSVILM